jgi:ABC-type molybdate transport system substrate-binding protein
MKRTLALLLCLVILLSMTACGGKKAEPTEITVFAAASMTEAMTEIKEA